MLQISSEHNDCARSFEPAAGILDTRFGASGLVVIDFGGRFDSAAAVQMLTDCRLVVAGSTGAPSAAGSAYDVAAARFTADGDLDTGFGSQGIVRIDIAGAQDRAAAVGQQADGKLLIAATTRKGSSDTIVLIRLLSDGLIDTAFGQSGVTEVAIPEGNGRATGLAIRPDGGILVSGAVTRPALPAEPRSSIILAGFTDAGVPDITFGTSGVVELVVGDSSAAEAIALQPDAKIVAAGWSSSSGRRDLLVTRFNSDGKTDQAFGKAGVVTLDCGMRDGSAAALAVAGDGTIVAAGQCSSGVMPQGDILATGTSRRSVAMVVRLTPSGDPDDTFGAGGIVSTAIGSDNEASAEAVALQPDGRILLAGIAREGGQADVALARFLSDGSLDATFGRDGIILTDAGGEDRVRAMTLQSDGAAVIVGTSFISAGPSRVILARYR